MLRIDRYVLNQLAVGMILVTLGLTGILWLTQSLRFIELVVNRGAGITAFLRLTLLVMPNFLTVILPISLFVVVLFTYDRLIADRELVALRAAGVSHWDLARPALFLAGICTVIELFLNLWLIPLSVNEFHRLQFAIRSNATSVLVREGTFNEIGNGLTIYAKERKSDGTLTGLIVNDGRNPDRPVTVMAERGALVITENAPPRVLLFNGTRQEMLRATHQLSLLYFDFYAMEFSFGAGQADLAGNDPREQTMQRLFSATEDSVGATLYRQYRVEAHQRLATPFYNFAFALLATACLLVGHFNRRGQTPRILIAIALMVAAQAIGLSISDVAPRNLALLPLIYIGPLLPALGGAWALLRPALWERPRRGGAIPA